MIELCDSAAGMPPAVPPVVPPSVGTSAGGDPEGMKRCRRCGEVKGVGAFYKGRAKCKVCEREADGLRRATRKEEDPGYMERRRKIGAKSRAKRKEEDPVEWAAKQSEQHAKKRVKIQALGPADLEAHRVRLRKISVKSRAKRKVEDPVGWAAKQCERHAKNKDKNRDRYSMQSFVAGRKRQNGVWAWRECGRCGVLRWRRIAEWREVNFCGDCWLGHRMECRNIKKQFRRKTG